MVAKGGDIDCTPQNDYLFVFGASPVPDGIVTFIIKKERENASLPCTFSRTSWKNTVSNDLPEILYHGIVHFLPITHDDWSHEAHSLASRVSYKKESRSQNDALKNFSRLKKGSESYYILLLFCTNTFFNPYKLPLFITFPLKNSPDAQWLKNQKVSFEFSRQFYNYDHC